MKWGIQFANMGPFSDPDLTCLLAQTAEEAGRFEELGVKRLVIRARSRDPQELRDELLRFGDAVIARN